MTPFNRLLRNLREEFGNLREDVNETLYGNRSLRALDEEIRDAHAQLQELRGQLATLKAQRYTRQERIDAVSDAIAMQEEQAGAALAADDSRLAYRLAERIAGQEAELEELHRQLQQLDLLRDQLQDDLDHGEGRIRRLKQQLDIVRTSQGILNAQTSVAKRQAGAAFGLHTAIDSVARLKQQQVPPRKRPGRQAKPAAAGAAPERTEAVLERIQQQHHAASTRRPAAGARRKPKESRT